MKIIQYNIDVPVQYIDICINKSIHNIIRYLLMHTRNKETKRKSNHQYYDKIVVYSWFLVLRGFCIQHIILKILIEQYNLITVVLFNLL